MQAETEAVRLAVDALLEHQAKFMAFQASPEWVEFKTRIGVGVDTIDVIEFTLEEIINNESHRKLYEFININTTLIDAMNRAVGAWWVAKLQIENWWQGDKTPDDRIRVRFDGKGTPYALLYRV